MSVRSREIKVLAAFLASMTAGVIILMALGNDPPFAGAFCLSGYYGLEPVEKVIFSELAQPHSRWDRIAVYYSGTEGGTNGPENIACHFVACNGIGGADGQIQPTEKWHKQRSIIPGRSRDGSGQTIHICVIADAKTTHPTDLQMRRVETLVEALCREFDIEPESVHYPNDWQ